MFINIILLDLSVLLLVSWFIIYILFYFFTISILYLSICFLLLFFKSRYQFNKLILIDLLIFKTNNAIKTFFFIYSLYEFQIFCYNNFFPCYYNIINFFFIFFIPFIVFTYYYCLFLLFLMVVSTLICLF